MSTSSLEPGFNQATSPSCVACSNPLIKGTFKCQGCSQTFCPKHTDEHRDILRQQLDEIILERQQFLDNVDPERLPASILFDHIDRWEKESIGRIQHVAEQARLDLQQIAGRQRESTRKKFAQLTELLDQARLDDHYMEQDLYRWAIQLEQLKYDLTNVSPSIYLHHDEHEITVAKINEQSLVNDSLTSDSERVFMDEDRHIVLHCGPYRDPTYISGTREYDSGEHRIRLFISKQTHDFILSFNIMSASMTLPPTSVSTDSPLVVYGWQSDDCVNPWYLSVPAETSSHDLKGRTQFHIEFILDCHQRKISYFNERTRRTRELNVDLVKCPLPWKLLFYLYDVGDCVRILSSS